jgi:hypothetical protein
MIASSFASRRFYTRSARRSGNVQDKKATGALAPEKCRRQSSSSAAVRLSVSPPPRGCQPPDLPNDQLAAIERNLITPSPTTAPGIVERLNRRPSSPPHRPFLPQVRHGPVSPDHLIDRGIYRFWRPRIRPSFRYGRRSLLV